MGIADVNNAKSTSYIERQNLTMRMSMRRFTRLTNAFSKKLENHHHSVPLHVMNDNLIRSHQTLACTPAMAAGVADRLLALHDILEMMDRDAPKPDRSKRYRKRRHKTPNWRSVGSGDSGRQGIQAILDLFYITLDAGDTRCQSLNLDSILVDFLCQIDRILVDFLCQTDSTVMDTGLQFACDICRLKPDASNL